MKNKVEIGQCYEYRDRAFMVVDGPIYYNKVPFWNLQNTITKEIVIWEEKGILTLPRPFPNWG